MAEFNQQALQRLQESINRSRSIMQMEKNGTLNQMANEHRSEINESINNGGATPTLNTQVKKRTPNFNNTKSKLPKEIQESFAKNYIDPEAYLNGGVTSSILDSLQPIPNNTPQQQQTITEQKQTTSYTGGSNGIDYPTIRAIVEETVRKYIEPLQKQVLNESVQTNNNVHFLTLGKSFKFVSKNGDIFEAKLTKVGNVNKE